MIDVGRELRELRQTLAQLIGAIDATAMRTETATRVVTIPAGGPEATEMAPRRPDRLRLRVQVATVGPVQIGENPGVAVKGGWRLILDGPPFIDEWPVAARGAWYAWSAVASSVVVTETIRVD